MKIKIEEVSISKDTVDLIVSLRGVLSDENEWRFKEKIENKVLDYIVEKMASEFMSKHSHEIIGKIDQQQILNLIALRSAGTLFEKNR